MKKIKKDKVSVIVAALFCLYSLSCKKNAIEKNDLLAYVAQNLSAYNEIPINKGDAVISNVGLIYTENTRSGFPVFLAEPPNSDVEITGRIDNNPELIKAYDSLYRSHSPILPQDLFKMVGNGKLYVKAGHTESIDSMKIEINNVSGLAAGTYTFVVPIVIETTAKNVKLESKLMFMRYNIVVKQVKASISGLSGDADIALLNEPNVDKNIFVQALLSDIVHQAIEVSVEEVDSKTFLDAFNTKHNSSYLPFPEGAYNLLHRTATIPANNKVSTQSIQIQLTDLSLFNTTQTYLLALRIKENGVPSKIDPKNNIVYISMQRNNLDAPNAILTGEPIDRTGWTVVARGSYSSFVPANILDGKNETAWDSDGRLPQWLTLDMGMTQTVKGFSIVPNYEYPDEDFIHMDVLSSNDGKSWKIEGKYIGSPTSAQSSADQPDLKTIKFINPVTARFFKFNITKTTEGRSSGMAEIYGIK